MKQLFCTFFLFVIYISTISTQITADPDYLIVGRDELPQNGENITDAFLFYDVNKSAFRGGLLIGSNWNPEFLGSCSFAYGHNVSASGGFGATALGYYTRALGEFGASALGGLTTASGDFGATALGYLTTASGDFGATTLGINTTANGNSCTVVGTYNDTIVASGTIVSETSPLFIVGNGNSGVGGKSNAMIVRKDGRIGIGTNFPEGLAHISAGLNGDAELILESDTNNAGSENHNPTITLRQDGNTINAFIAMEGHAGTKSTGTIGNSFLFGSERNNVSLHFITSDSSRMTIKTNGRIAINKLGSAGSTQLCRNGLLELSTCSSSIRYKKQIENYAAGLDMLDQLRPVSYKWKESNLEDIGFIAEEIAEIDERFITRNGAGEIEGVKYDRFTTILVNAVKEQQTDIESLKELIKIQGQQILNLMSKENHNVMSENE